MTGDAEQDRPNVQEAADRVDEAVRVALHSGSDAFDVVRGVANGSKHGLTRQKHAIPFTAGTDWERPPAMAGRMMCGISMCGDFTGGREIPHVNARIDLYQAIHLTLSAFIIAFPDHLGDSSCELSTLGY